MREDHRHLLGAIEAGGTKWICAVGTPVGEVIEEVVVRTRRPAETLPEVRAAFDGLQERHGEIGAMGIGTFGPVGVARRDPDYGVILNSPKTAWRGFDYLAAMEEYLGRGFPVVVDTDVNAAALAEDRADSNREVTSLIYVTVGTGIGGGMIQEGKIWHGRQHPEMGHLLVPESSKEQDPGFSACPFHGFCVEGKASGTAMKKRWGRGAEELPEGHPGWELEAEYLASMAVSLTAGCSPDRIVFGGGVMRCDTLMAMIREKFSALAGGYWELPPVEDYLAKSVLNDRAGLRGALLLAAGIVG